MTDFAERIARLEDRAALQDLVVRYFLASDGDDLATIRDTFTEDGRFAVSGQPMADGAGGIVDFIVAQRAHMGLTLHTPNYALFTFDGPDRARGLVGAHLQMMLGGESIFGAVRYQDDYARIDGDWRIRTRDMRTVFIAPWADVGDALASATPQRWPGTAPAPSDFPRNGAGLAHSTERGDS